MDKHQAELLEDTARRVDRLDRALFEVPPGSPQDERPLIEGLRIVWRQYQRGSWLARVLIWLVPAIAAGGAAVAQIKGWMPWSGKQ